MQYIRRAFFVVATAVILFSLSSCGSGGTQAGEGKSKGSASNPYAIGDVVRLDCYHPNGLASLVEGEKFNIESHAIIELTVTGCEDFTEEAHKLWENTREDSEKRYWKIYISCKILETDNDEPAEMFVRFTPYTVGGNGQKILQGRDYIDPQTNESMGRLPAIMPGYTIDFAMLQYTTDNSDLKQFSLKYLKKDGYEQPIYFDIAQ